MLDFLRVALFVALSWHLCSSTHECNRTIAGDTMTFVCPSTVSNQLLRLNDLTSDQLDAITTFIAIGGGEETRGPFTSIPPNICMMPNLRTINFANNRIVTVDNGDALADCGTNVVTLDLTNNTISNFPSYLIYNLRNLKNLYMSRNVLTEVPVTAFYNVSALDILDFSNNRLTTFELWTLDVRVRVDLSNNRITMITNRYFYTSTATRMMTQGVFLTGNGPTINFTDAVYPMYDQCDEVALWFYSNDEDPAQPIFTGKMGRINFGTTRIPCSCNQLYFLKVFAGAYSDPSLYPIGNATCTSDPESGLSVRLFSSGCANASFDTNITMDFTRVYPRLCMIRETEGGTESFVPVILPPTGTAIIYPHYETVDMEPGTCFMTFSSTTLLTMSCTNDTSATQSRIPSSVLTSTFMSTITRVTFPTTISSLPQYLCSLPSGTIDLSNQAFTTLSDATFPCLDSFRQVVLSSNQIASVNMNSGNFRNLTSLDLSSNRLTSLPYSILTPTPTSLSRLDLRNNSIDYVDLYLHTRRNISVLLDGNPINNTVVRNPLNTTLVNMTSTSGSANVSYPTSVRNGLLIVDDSVAVTYGVCNDFQSLRSTLLMLKSVSTQTQLDCSCRSINLKTIYANNSVNIFDDFPTCRSGTNEDTFGMLTLASCPNRTDFSSGLCSTGATTSVQSSSPSDNSNRTALIIGLVVGLVGLLLCILAIIAAILIIRCCKRGGGGGKTRRVSRTDVNGRSTAEGKAQPTTPAEKLKSRYPRGLPIAPTTSSASVHPAVPVGAYVVHSNNNTLTSANRTATLRGSMRGIPLRLDPIKSQVSTLPPTSPPVTTTLASPPALHATSSVSSNSMMPRPLSAPRPIPAQVLNTGGDTRF